jgi:hypothetical protein
MDKIVTIRPYDSKDWDTLVKNATADNHSGVYLSIGVVPTVLCWQHSQKVGPLDSLRLLGHLEGSLRQFKQICIPCDPESPYNKLLPKAGYVEYSKLVKLFIKV